MNRHKQQIKRAITIVVILCSIGNAGVFAQTIDGAMPYDTVGVLNGIFDIPELVVTPSPSTASKYTFGVKEKVADYDVSPSGIEVATIVDGANGRSGIKFWAIGKSSLSDSCSAPEGVKCTAIAWHPKANALFLMGNSEGKYFIFRGDKRSGLWAFAKIFTSEQPLRRLLVCPRPFIVSYDEETQQNYYTYRLFFGMGNGKKSFRIVSITESGNSFYQVVGPAAKDTTVNNPRPDGMISDWALPMAFHPGGHKLIFADKANNFYSALYSANRWDGFAPINSTLKDGTITPTPNGLGLLHWKKKQLGIGLYMLSTKTEELQLTDYNFATTPSSVPDGKGIVGLTIRKGHQTLNYLPINVPLADVVNAWMFAKSNEEVAKLDTHNGLFRPNKGEQLYNLYETENYDCNSYSRNSPTRPYLVTTDIFWELFGAAYQGLFIIKERDEAIPSFWNFINEADNYIKTSGKPSEWTPVLSALRAYNAGSKTNEEVAKIIAEKDDISSVLNEQYPYSELKVRGHYASSLPMAKYFKALRYFSTIYKNNPKAMKELNDFSPAVKASAEKWISSYEGFISSSRAPIIWNNTNNIPAYCKYPQKEATIFPLSWGFDNETLNSTVYHDGMPKNEIIEGPNGRRYLPSGLDLATVLGNSLADSLLNSDYQAYPNLRGVIDNLKSNFSKSASDTSQSNNLYNKWINAISVQWASSLPSVGGEKDKAIWQSKRLQTGLATWATLRHATVLVNERTAAECGEGGFEEILMRAPRGYVEPDPNTFLTIANLFEAASKYISNGTVQSADIVDYEYTNSPEVRSLYDGIKERLKDAANEARTFALMAEKERKGINLTNTENEKILFVARTAEHLFLIFNSLANKDYALSTPDPMAKIADVAGDGTYLMAAVGNAMEWDYVTPFYGRHQITKGSIYSYYEFSSNHLLNDVEWRKKANTQEILPWLKPFITYKEATGAPVTGY